MNPSSQGPELSKETLDKKYSFSFTVAELLAMRAAILQAWKQFQLGDAKLFIEILDKMQTVLNFTQSDFKKPENPTPPTQAPVVVN